MSTYTSFWKNTSCFSTWHPSTFVVGTQTYNTAQQYMMQHKEITATWHVHTYAVVLDATRAKFTQNSDMAVVLLQTGVLEIVETSPYNRVLGIGFTTGQLENNRAPRELWGQNLLGKALMQIRGELLNLKTNP